MPQVGICSLGSFQTHLDSLLEDLKNTKRQSREKIIEKILERVYRESGEKLERNL